MKTVDFKLIENEPTTKNHVRREIVNVWRALYAITKRDSVMPFPLKPPDNYISHN